MNNKLLEIAEKAYMDMITSKGSEQDKKDSLCIYFAEYVRSKVPEFEQDEESGQDEEITGEFKSKEDIDKFFLEKYNV